MNYKPGNYAQTLADNRFRDARTKALVSGLIDLL